MSIRHLAASMLLAYLATAIPARADEPSGLSNGQTIYAPVYSHVYHGNLDRTDPSSQILLSAMLSVRNTDPSKPITIRSVNYYNTEGKVVRRFLTEPRMLGPLASMDAFIEGSDKAGGSGANFLVVWKAQEPASPPLVETVHSYFFGATSLAFVTRGVPVAGSKH